jgi:hypothetical protein
MEEPCVAQERIDGALLSGQLSRPHLRCDANPQPLNLLECMREAARFVIARSLMRAR